MEFSLCAIYKNEEKLLNDFIDKHIQLFDEIILVDTGSDDESNIIIKSRGLQYNFYKWDDNFSNARNYSLSLATKPYIIVLDIDERFTKESLIKLKSIIKKENRDAYSLKQINFSNDKSAKNWQYILQLENEASVKIPKEFINISEGYITSPLIRVFKNNRGVYFSGIIHEIVAESMEKNRLSSIRTDIPIFHLGWIDKSRTEEINKKKKTAYNELIKKAWETEKTAKSAYYYLIGLPSDEKIKMSFKLIKLFPKVKEFYQIRASAALELKEFERALSYSEKGLESFPDDIILLSTKSKSLIKLFRLEEALLIIEKILKKSPYDFNILFEKIKILIALSKISEAEKIIKNLPENFHTIYKKELFSLSEYLNL